MLQKIIKFLFMWLILKNLGAIQYVLGKQGCADNQYDTINRCPLPRFFNHNAILHILTCIALTFTFIAELVTVRKNQKRAILKNKNLSNQNTDNFSINSA